MNARFKVDSPAVMARRAEPRDSLDDFPTPPWATRALSEHALPHLRLRRSINTVLEPAAGRGHMVLALDELFLIVEAADVHDYGAGFEVRDFLADDVDDFEDFQSWDAVITNPPFRLAARFARRALWLAPTVALLVRTAWTESVERYRLFAQHPPALIAQFAERVPMVRGRCDPRASTATAYCWVIWAEGQTDTRWRHIPPCRRALERDGDYDEPVIARRAEPDEAIQDPGSPRALAGPRDDGTGGA